MDNTETDKIEKTGRLTNQLQYLKNVHRIVWRHHYAWPFHKPVDPVALKIPVSIVVILLGILCVLTWLKVGLTVWGNSLIK